MHRHGICRRVVSVHPSVCVREAFTTLVSTNSRTMNVGSESSKYDMMMRRTSACWHSRYVVAVTVLLTGDGCRSAVAVLTFSASEGVPCGAHHVTVAADYCRQ